jgi:hypothetical protein
MGKRAKGVRRLDTPGSVTPVPAASGLSFPQYKETLGKVAPRLWCHSGASVDRCKSGNIAMREYLPRKAGFGQKTRTRNTWRLAIRFCKLDVELLKSGDGVREGNALFFHPRWLLVGPAFPTLD